LWNCDGDCANSNQTQNQAAYDVHDAIPPKRAALQEDRMARRSLTFIPTQIKASVAE
jgi:hypothetical protein